jgi:hypothetical protein
MEEQDASSSSPSSLDNATIVHVVYRQMSMYSEASLLIGVFRTATLAEQAKQAYIAKVTASLDAQHFRQGYQDVELDKDVCIDEQVLNHVPAQFAENPDELQLGDQADADAALAPGHRIWVLSCESQGMGQISRGEACFFTSAALQEQARQVLQPLVDGASWPTCLVGDEVRLDAMRTRNLDLWMCEPLEGADATPLVQVRCQLGKRVNEAARSYHQMQRDLDRAVVDQRSRRHRNTPTFCDEWKPLLADPTWPGLAQLHRAHGIVLVWFVLSLDAAEFACAESPLDVLALLETRVLAEETASAAPLPPDSTDYAARSKHEERLVRAHALRYLVNDFCSTPIVAAA